MNNTSTRQNTAADHREELFIALQRLLPQHALSRLLGRLAECEQPWLKNFLIHQAVKHYRIDLSDAFVADPLAYPSFNSFFTRELKPGARPLDGSANGLASPADGAISQIGTIADGQIFQAKGHSFSTAALLACSEHEAARFGNGSFATIYLAPRDYHRVHMPIAGNLVASRYIPGKLFSVNDTTARRVDGLFARNERLVCLFDTAFGQVAVVLVGALFVAGIQTVWQREFTPGRLQQRNFDPPLQLEKGAELGAFKFGSTVVVVTEQAVTWQEGITATSRCLMGQSLGGF